jgi:anti-sigma factor RsiW
MNCNQMEDVLLDYAAGRLAGADRASAEQHLTVCPGCRERAAGFRAVAQVLEDWDTPQISPWFNARLRQRIARIEADEALGWNWRQAFGWLTRPVTAAAFAAVLMVGSLAVWTSRPSTVPQIAAKPVVQDQQKAQVDELLPVVEDFDMLADFEVIQDMKTASVAKTPKNKM